MLERPILILSSWLSGSPLVAGFLGQCGGYLCPPFAKSLNSDTQITYESEMFRGLVSATVNEFSFDYKVDPTIFRNGFRSWYYQQVEEANSIDAQRIILNHPLSVFLLDEICQVVDPVFLLVTRPFEKIESSRAKQKLEPTYGEYGARVIYERAYSYLHEREKTFMTFSFKNFAASHLLRMQIVDFCDLDVSENEVRVAFETVFPRK